MAKITETFTQNYTKSFSFLCNLCIDKTELAWHFVQMALLQSVAFVHHANHRVILAEVQLLNALIVYKINLKGMYLASLAIKTVLLERLVMILKCSVSLAWMDVMFVISKTNLFVINVQVHFFYLLIHAWDHVLLDIGLTLQARNVSHQISQQLFISHFCSLLCLHLLYPLQENTAQRIYLGNTNLFYPSLHWQALRMC